MKSAFQNKQSSRFGEPNVIGNREDQDNEEDDDGRMSHTVQNQRSALIEIDRKENITPASYKMLGTAKMRH